MVFPKNSLNFTKIEEENHRKTDRKLMENFSLKTNNNSFPKSVRNGKSFIIISFINAYQYLNNIFVRENCSIQHFSDEKDFWFLGNCFVLFLPVLLATKFKLAKNFNVPNHCLKAIKTTIFGELLLRVVIMFLLWIMTAEIIGTDGSCFLFHFAVFSDFLYGNQLSLWVYLLFSFLSASNYSD